MYCLRALMLVWTANLCTASSDCVLEWKLWRAGTQRHLSEPTAEDGRRFRLENSSILILEILWYWQHASSLCKCHVIQRELTGKRSSVWRQHLRQLGSRGVPYGVHGINRRAKSVSYPLNICLKTWGLSISRWEATDCQYTAMWWHVGPWKVACGVFSAIKWRSCAGDRRNQLFRRHPFHIVLLPL